MVTSPPLRRTPLLLIPLAAIGFAVAGCGGGSGGSQGALPTTTGTTLTISTEPTTEAATTEQVTTEVATTPTGGGLAGTKDCRELLDLGAKLSAVQSGTGSAQDLKKAAGIIRSFAHKAPAEIRADFNLYADYVAKIADAYAGLKPGALPDAETIAKLQKVSSEIDVTKISAARQRITAWVLKNCSGSNG